MKTNEELLKENAELKLALGIAASFPVKIRAECRKRINMGLVSINLLEMLLNSANRALSKIPEQHLADIKADAVLDVANNWIIRKDADYNTRRKLAAISNKIRGEDK